jgi:DNA-binding response OmpR family regulator
LVQPPVPSQAAARSAVVVDSALERDDRGLLHEDDSSFGDLSRELSVVAELPKQPEREAHAERAPERGRPEPRLEPARPVVAGVEAPSGPAPHTKTVLVVDDEPDIRKLLRRVFEERGYRVLDADRGLAALRIVKETPPDIIVLDAMLPEMHGFELARRLKGSQRYGRIPIIMVSAVYKGWRIAEDVKTSYGVDAYIEKPFKISDVLGAVEQAIVKAETASEASSDPDAISAEAERLLEAGIAAYRAGDVHGAIASLVAGTQIDPLAYRLHLHLGLLYGKEGQVYEAIQELETALNINSQHFPALKNLAVLYQKAGFRNKAVEMWERALKHAPDDATRAQIKQHLVSLL